MGKVVVRFKRPWTHCEHGTQHRSTSRPRARTRRSAARIALLLVLFHITEGVLGLSRCIVVEAAVQFVEQAEHRTNVGRSAIRWKIVRQSPVLL